MMKTFAAVLAAASCAVAGPTDRPAELRITQKHLIATCYDGKPISGSERSWTVTAPVSIAFTMRNEPRPGVKNASPGVAAVSFEPEAGHKYEIEVRAPATAYSQRVWSRGEWTVVVRDRQTDRIVSHAPQSLEGGCGTTPAS
jgi:hypothetical protein